MNWRGERKAAHLAESLKGMPGRLYLASIYSAYPFNRSAAASR
jgi:hypothetical protein